MFTYKIYQNGKFKKEFNKQKNDFCVFKYLLDNQSQSTEYALKYGDWSVDIINEKTKEKSKY